jgi:hypothetical protein
LFDVARISTGQLQPLNLSFIIIREQNTKINNYVWGGIKILEALRWHTYTYIHTYHSRSIPEGAAEASQILLRDTHVLPKLVSYEEHCRRDRW